MKWLRSYPIARKPGEQRRYVVDEITESFLQDNYDYTQLVRYDADILLIEWDMAASMEDMGDFARHASYTPSQVLVAPYKLYENRVPPVWAHRRVQSDGTERWIATDEPYCEYFGFGMVYLPRHLIRAFVDADPLTRGTPIGVEPHLYTDYRFIDQTFSVWHWQTTLEAVQVDWSVRPVHLHY